MSISYIIPSINRKSLTDTISSIEMQPGDEICLEFDLPPTGKWGNPQRNRAMARAKGRFLAFIDDHDLYVKGHRQIMQTAIEANPGLPNLFRVQLSDGQVIWEKKELFPGNVTGIGLLIPNSSEMFNPWEENRHLSDFLFIKNWKWPIKNLIWREEIIATAGNNDMGKGKHS